MPRPIQPNELHTYDDWQRLGYQVQRGERHLARDNWGRALFGASQVRPREPARPPPPGSYNPRPGARVRRARAANGQNQTVPQISQRWPSNGQVFVSGLQQFREEWPWNSSDGWLAPSTFRVVTPVPIPHTSVSYIVDEITDEVLPNPACLRQRVLAEYVPPADEPTGFQKFNQRVEALSRKEK